MNRTICALSTPPGAAGIAVIRISGEEAFAIAGKIFRGKKSIKDAASHTILYGKVVFREEIIDNVTVSVFKKPNSYTGEDVVEISSHGGLIIPNKILNALNINGAEFAGPGEFTRRAFLNGKMDLTQVEAVADLIHSISSRGTQTSARQLNGAFTERISRLRQELMDICSLLELELDFADEDLEFVENTEIAKKIDETHDYCLELANSFEAAEILRSGYFVAIAGYPNAGKSTLFNKLLQRERAIVTEIPGTTRDYLEEVLYIDEIPIRIIDTAGMRESTDRIEIEGIKLVNSVMEESNMLIVLNDVGISPENSDALFEELKSRYSSAEVILAQNKIDLAEKFDKRRERLCISSKDDTGIDELKERIAASAKKSIQRINDVLLNRRHANLLTEASDFLNKAKDAIAAGMENEIISIEVRSAIKKLGELTGETWNEEILNNIFSKFCIGK